MGGLHLLATGSNRPKGVASDQPLMDEKLGWFVKVFV